MNNNITFDAFALELEKAAAHIMKLAKWVREEKATDSYHTTRIINHYVERGITQVVDGYNRIGGDSSIAIEHVVRNRMTLNQREDLLIMILEWEKEAKKLPRVEYTMREYPTMDWASRHISEIK